MRSLAQLEATLVNALVLSGESPAEFIELLRSYLDTFKPTDPVQFDLVTEMVAAKWRQRRAWRLETATLDLEVMRGRDEVDQEFNHIDSETRLAVAHESLCNKTNPLASIRRAEAAAIRQYDRALKNLLALRKAGIAPSPLPLTADLQNEPEPEPAPEVSPAVNENACLQNEPEPLLETSAAYPPDPELTLDTALLAESAHCTARADCELSADS